MEERGVQREAKLNGLRDAGSPQEAKWPSVILHTQAGSAPTFSFFPYPFFLGPVWVHTFNIPVYYLNQQQLIVLILKYQIVGQYEMGSLPHRVYSDVLAAP